MSHWKLRQLLHGSNFVSQLRKTKWKSQNYQQYCCKTNPLQQQAPKIVKKSVNKHYIRYGLGLVVVSILAYDGYVNEFIYCGAAVRFLRSMKCAALIAGDYMLLSEWDENYEKKLKVIHKRSAERLLATCLTNGGLYIKVGQGVAAINHILPKEYTQTLMKLQDECLYTTKKDVQQVFRQEFGQLPEKIYDEFDYKPIAAASLAQVFKAKLKTGEEVAVKVQYGDLKRRFVSDLGTIISLQNIVEFFFKGYNFGWIMRDLRLNLMQELNFKNEGANAERCATDMKKFQFVHVPKVYWDYTRERVLTLEWIDGIKLTDMQGIKRQGLSVKDIDLKLYQVFAEQIFNSGFVHADPHSSNVFVRRGKRRGGAEIVILDHGLYEEVPESVRQPLCEFWEATVLRDKQLMKQTAAKLNIREYLKFAEVLFQQPFDYKVSGIKNKLTEQDIKHMQAVAKENFDRIMDTLKEMPRNLLFVVRNLNTIRAIGRHHGDVVDRPKVMARHAQHYIYNKSGYSLPNYMRWLCRRIHFEYCLWRTAFKLNFLQFYLNVLYRIGRAPLAARTVLKDLMKMPYD